ncbi:MAG: AI-2E family transporter, partial [Actinomycetota bacterium]
MQQDREGGAERTQLRITAWSIVRSVAIVAGALALVAFVAAASRPLGWVAVAVMAAALAQPAISGLGRWIPRGLAVLVVVLLTLGLVGGLAFGVIGDLSDQITRIERAAPRAARDVERSERFGELAREVELGRRVDEFVEGLPDRLRGGDDVDAIRSAATRGVAFLITLVLSIFLIVSGPRLLDAGFSQIRDPDRRARVKRLMLAAHARWWRYLLMTLGRMVAAGLFAYLVARAIDVPGPVLLALWVAAWSIMPTIGVFVGSAAVALLAVPESFGTAGAVLVFFAAYQVLEDAVVQPRLERA